MIGKKVKCIKDMGTGGALILNKIYTCINSGEGHVWVIDELGYNRGWYADRFVEIKEKLDPRLG